MIPMTGVLQELVLKGDNKNQQPNSGLAGQDERGTTNQKQVTAGLLQTYFQLIRNTEALCSAGGKHTDSQL